MNSTIEQSPLYPLARDIKAIGKSLKYQVHRQFGRVDAQLVENYLRQHDVRKLHIGCGYHMLDGWLNSDYQAIPKDILQVDATKTFPIDSNKFDYIFTEHMIEHILYPQGLSMLSECFRVLRKNGTIRVSTPDLQFAVGLYQDRKTDPQKEYIKSSIEHFIAEDTNGNDDVFVINNLFRAWGHQFIYDEKTLRNSLEKAGFKNIVRCDLGQSSKQALQNIENGERLPLGSFQPETLTLEGEKLEDS
ncbi:methyltransferase domain-containing protein [Chamaesiphon sp. VAR_69_metabat_338]|uniref:class I SAM-dependent methyltransferase n=1 Tax=Chamaesiphon sp. VAR_69_metabat_338 TaxID=2964704 RepID=UPI00286E7FF9|nr:methyltransferase domain-containing protein [Chamaesiphon sp. VAR_69_metabat_338]